MEMGFAWWVVVIVLSNQVMGNIWVFAGYWLSSKFRQMSDLDFQKNPTMHLLTWQTMALTWPILAWLSVREAHRRLRFYFWKRSMLKRIAALAELADKLRDENEKLKQGDWGVILHRHK
jgi:hypothetical protein